MVNLVRDLMAHAEWANSVFFEAWGQSPARDHEELRERLAHLIGVQRGFLSILRSEAPGGPKHGPPPTFDEMKMRAQICHAGLNDYVATLEPDNLSRMVRIHWFKEPPCVITVAQALVQVAMHSQHHRGQCMTRLKDFGGQSQDVDWIIWLWKGKPPAHWS